MLSSFIPLRYLTVLHIRSVTDGLPEAVPHPAWTQAEADEELLTLTRDTLYSASEVEMRNECKHSFCCYYHALTWLLLQFPK